MTRTRVREQIDGDGNIVKVVEVGARGPVEITQAIGALDMDNLSGETATAGGLAVYFGVLYAEALAQQRRAKMSVEITKATIGKRLRAAAVRDAQKVTERAIEEEILTSSEYQRAESAHIDAEEMANILRGVQTASEQKHKIVTALGLQVGRELDARRGPARQAMRGLMDGEPRGGKSS